MVGPCAELVALATARTNGARRLTTIVAVGHDHRGVLPPCGRDRQVLFDYHPDIRVILPTPDGLRSVRIEDLLPLSYRWSPICTPYALAATSRMRTLTRSNPTWRWLSALPRMFSAMDSAALSES